MRICFTQSFFFPSVCSLDWSLNAMSWFCFHCYSKDEISLLTSLTVDLLLEVANGKHCMRSHYLGIINVSCEAHAIDMQEKWSHYTPESDLVPNNSRIASYQLWTIIKDARNVSVMAGTVPLWSTCSNWHIVILVLSRDAGTPMWTATAHAPHIDDTASSFRPKRPNYPSANPLPHVLLLQVTVLKVSFTKVIFTDRFSIHKESIGWLIN